MPVSGRAATPASRGQVASFARAPGPDAIKRLKDAGIVCMPTIGARRHAEKVAEWGVDAVIASGGDNAAVAACLSDRWLSDNTLYGPVERVLEGLESWYDTGIKTPILVPSSAAGNQLQAIRELFDARERL